MNGNSGYAVFFYPQALEALGEAVKPYLQGGEAGPHISCSEVDTAGAFVEMTMFGRTADGRDITLELMVPSSMVRMIVSSQQAGSFGFRPHGPDGPVVVAATMANAGADASAEAAPKAPGGATEAVSGS